MSNAFEDLPLFGGEIANPKPTKAPSETSRLKSPKESPKKQKASVQPKTKVSAPKKTKAESLPSKTSDSTKPRAFSVSSLTSLIKKSIESEFQDVWVKGEISNFRPASSGHVYFSLKDEKANLSAVAFGWGRKKHAFQMKDGIQVLCHGKVSVYPPRGSYQIVVDEIQPLGAGALQIEFERLKAKLQSEGLFDQSFKKPIPVFPKKVAFVTSPTGAAIQDILNVLKRRAPQVEVLVVPALVQGQGASREIADAVEWVNQKVPGVDLLVVTRGGGSIEDLWAFNEEESARAIAKSKIPVISAVGHEIDFTIADFVSDLRAPTPSAGAEILSAQWVESNHRVRQSFERLKNSIRQNLTQNSKVLTHLSARVKSPRERLRERAQRCDELVLRLEQAVARYIHSRKDALSARVAKLDALSPLSVLQRGFAIVHDHDNSDKIIKSSKEISADQKIQIRLHDGSFSAKTL